jgi:hypothetical protein
MKYEYLNFVPGEVILHLECDPKFKSGDIKAEIDNHFNQAPVVFPWSELRWITEYQGLEKESILLFPRLGDANGQLVLVPLEMKKPEATEQDLAFLLWGIYNYIGILAGSTEIQIAKDIKLKSASPNWFMAGAHHQGSTGGPGGPPVMAALQTYLPGFSSVNAQISELLDTDMEENVDVVILDTAPSAGDFAKAKHQGWYAGHPLNDWLDKQPNTIDYAVNDRIRQLSFKRIAHFSLFDQHYKMPDHGLFVSGIIHTLAKAATLHWYEVLNPYGLGTYYTVAQALSKVLDNDDIKGPLIINCSLTLDIPRSRHPMLSFPFDRRTNFFQFTVESVKILFDRIARFENIIVVAAAGNDRRRVNVISLVQPILNISRPDARYPAAYTGTVGVGASPKFVPDRHDPASYSNVSDDPSVTGYMVFGGEAGSGNGVLGVYICDFPINPIPVRPGGSVVKVQYDTNTSGWAWWCGTSFATAIMSGLLAAWWGNPSSQAPIDAITFLNNASTSTITGTGEREIIITQP